MSGEGGSRVSHSPRQSRVFSRSIKAPLIAILGLIATVSVCDKLQPLQVNLFGRNDSSQTPPSWNWRDLRPDRSLQWNKCYGGAFECARLDVPMDWQDSSNSERVTLGVMKLPARSKENPLPPVFANPGGPGGSGVDFLKTLGRALQIIVGDNQDIISWDPRGVGVSTPRVECWGNALRRQMWELQDTGVVDERQGLVYDAFSRSVAWAGACEAALNGTKLLQHLSTPHHARDMLEILDKTGHPKLRYWGISYGTALGGVFAGLYPDRVERLVSDGNVDYGEYFGRGLHNFLRDADSILDAFDSACHAAGPEACALWAPSAKAIEQRRANLLASLKKRPVLVPAWSRESGPDMPQRITYSKLQRLTRAVVYSPSFFFEIMARGYAALEAGDGPRFYDVLRAAVGQGNGPPEANPVCSQGDTPAAMPREIASEPDAFSAIMSSDSQGPRSLEEFEDYVAYLRESSRWLGAAHADFGAGYAGRSVEPRWRFSKDDIKADTAFPILFIGNTGDNVTPLESTYNNSAHFPSSSVLVQKSFGHASIAAPSTCTAQHIRAYFQNGTLPVSGTQCEQDIGLFEDSPLQSSTLGPWHGRELSRAVYEFSREAAVQMLRGVSV
ncbi:alpha/beta hydrolase fold domain-containing protein [Hirsutella rhossiliensis]|uniref:Alpha/beta hydrolase fold domain-containing protein n=1 Tax=Hirsutella rhossiliensis TaxID=111463 RepID=A0A9P8N1V2_9HYPO|nr:alpha/beta hydrolase fold domain-containing protein [Hirsutella rhossiliensis]KAH0966683.1 alpha/beta hydrolase fold domain-containing protein [Hirsutella rhossiliensis]